MPQKLKDMLGHKSGKLTVIKRADLKPNPKRASGVWWYSQCDCGNPELVLLSGHNIRSGRTKSCGCLIVEHAKSLQDSPTQALIAYRKRPTPMATCHPELPQEAKGLCGACYNKLKQTYNPERDKAKYRERMQKPENKYTTDSSGIRKRQLKYLYNITPEYYEEMFREQNGLCACCKQPESAVDKRSGKVKRLQVDHAHSCCAGKRSCGKCVRGLNCWRCNVLLGRINDNPELLDAMAAYLRAGTRLEKQYITRYVEECTVENLGL
jgi:hypothetical protein